MPDNRGLHEIVATIVSSNGFLKGLESRGDHLFVPKEMISYEEAIGRVEVTPTEQELNRLAALAPLDSSVHIRFALADAGFQLREGAYVHMVAGVRVHIQSTDEGDELFITAK